MTTATSLRADATRVADRAASIIRPRAHAVARRFGWMPRSERVRWFGARSPREASKALSARAAGLVAAPGQWVLIVGQEGPLRRGLERELSDRGIAHRSATTIGELELTAADSSTLACILASDVEVARVTAAARSSMADPGLAAIPFEYTTGLEPEADQMREQDEYSDSGFISPVLLADPSPYQLYSSSLERFEQKCGLRDYLDLYQLLESVVEREVEGDVVEFGSYKGHSGWLIGTTLKELESDKPVHLFDTFESFPSESAGVDYFWSGTHQVQLEEVAAKLAPLEAVRLVPGEFERTIPNCGIEPIALAYVDCDSYRAVSYLAGALFEERLSPGGFMVFEDYGHPALLGCRAAVHEYFDGRTDCVRFFSQFSGLYVVMKLATGQPSEDVQRR